MIKHLTNTFTLKASSAQPIAKPDILTAAYRLVYLTVLFTLLLSSYLFSFTNNANADSRIKDIVSFEGVRDNMLMGYGLVVGLNGTGDKLTNNAFTEQSLIAFLERQGVNTRGTSLKTKNVAAVTVTAKLPPFSRTGVGDPDSSRGCLSRAEIVAEGNSSR